jgi:hypothetical protein
VSAEVVASAEGDEPLLRLTFAEQLPPALDFLFDGVVRHLHDDGRDGDAVANDGAFTARVPKNFESSLRGDVASEQLAGLLPATVSRSTLANTVPYPPWSLLVTDLAVVNDRERTSDPCRDIVSPAATGMEWSFGYLMGHMTNWGGTGYKSASDFAKAWLSAWSTAITINGDPVTAPKILPPDFRATSPTNLSVPDYILSRWRLASRKRADGSLDPNTNPALKMEKAPLRLLAIVNRVDKGAVRLFGEGTGGELRFVFGVLDSDPSRSPWGSYCHSLNVPTVQPQSEFQNSTVILEYAVDKPALDWARGWRDLTLAGPPSNASYRTALQTLTDSVVKAGAGAALNRANKSALIRLRTNTSVDGVNWSLREFKISGGVLVPDTVKQTPADSFITDSKVLAQYVNTNGTDIIAETNRVPNFYLSGPFLGGQALNFSGGKFWSSIWIGDSLARHKFSLNTCNGCHSSETGTFFAHVMSRERNEEAPLSGFLTGITVSDPVTGEQRSFNDLDRRMNAMSTLLYGTLANKLSFTPNTNAD